MISAGNSISRRINNRKLRARASILICIFVILCFLAVVFYPVHPAFAATWSIQTADSTGAVGGYTSIALDSSNNPHISYRDSSNGDLKYARWTGSAWSIQAVDSAGDVGYYTSIALDSSNNPHISYRDSSNGDLKYARWTGSAWSIQAVDSAGDVGHYTSIALDSSNNPHISYWDSTNTALKYARWTGSAWSIQTVDSAGDVGRYTFIALDSSNNPHISYRDSSNGDLKYARWTGSAWSIQTVDSAGDVGHYTSIALDSSNNPHISYRDSSNGDLKYARWTGSAWSIQTVDSAGDIGYETSIALDSSNNPHISYRDGVNNDLKYARWTGSAWSIQTVDSAGDVGHDGSIALDSSNNPHISYEDGANNDLKYVRGNSPAIIINPISGLVTTEAGGTATFTVCLSTPPSADVTIGISSSDVTEGTVSPSSLTFTFGNWNTTQTVNVTGIDDFVADGTIAYTIITAAAVSTDIEYNGLNPSDVTVTNTDNDTNTGTVASATGQGNVSFTTSAGSLTDLAALNITSVPCQNPPGNFFCGLFSFRIVGLNPGDTINLTITLPRAGMTEYWKCINGGWVRISVAVLNGTTMTIQLKDGGLGDSDGIANGIIVDPGGPVIPIAPVPASGKPKPFAEPSSSPQMPEKLVGLPVKVSVKYLNVQPQQALINQPITIAANMANSGDESGQYVASLKINGQIEQTRIGTIGAHVAQPITFTVSKDRPGTYTVDINGQQSHFIVTSKTGNANNITTIMYIILIGMVMTCIILAILIIQRRWQS